MDFAWLDAKIFLEVEGGVWTGGRHTHPAGFVKDMEKYNTAASMGWLLLRTTPTKLTSKETIDFIVSAFEERYGNSTNDAGAS